MHQKGFTLVELLIVIIIIGILAGIVLALLSSARDQSRDTSTKSLLNQARTVSNLYLDNNNNSYGSSCGGGTFAACSTCFGGVLASDTTGSIFSLIQAAIKNSDGDITNTSSGRCKNTATSWVVGVKLRKIDDTGTPFWWCVDSTNVSKEEHITNPITGTRCI